MVFPPLFSTHAGPEPSPVGPTSPEPGFALNDLNHLVAGEITEGIGSLYKADGREMDLSPPSWA